MDMATSAESEVVEETAMETVTATLCVVGPLSPADKGAKEWT